jgi:hypothetical protein
MVLKYILWVMYKDQLGVPKNGFWPNFLPQTIYSTPEVQIYVKITQMGKSS